MAKCPKCGESIDKLLNQTPATAIYECSPTEDGRYLDYCEVDMLFLGGDGLYYCPECDEVIAKSDAEALALLKKE